MAATTAIAVVLLSSLFLFIYGSNLVFLSVRAARLHPATRAGPAAQPASVVVQIPIYNERYVARRVIDAALHLRWPRDRLEIQVLDDSDDDTTVAAQRAVARGRSLGIAISHLRRLDREGYKAGALAHGLLQTGAEFVAVFDADFVPPPDFLERLVPAFDDPRIGFVQARWSYLNEGFSLFTRLQALMTDFHFFVEQPVRPACGYFTNFTGSAGVWRRAAIDDAGGWSAETLTEDLDLSYRAQLRGWGAAYMEDVSVPQELPVSINAYRSQQARWAMGSFQCAFRLLRPVLKAPLPAMVRFQAAMHLLGYASPVMMLAQIACYPVLLWTAPGGRRPAGLDPAVAVSLLSLSPTFGLAVGQWRRGRSWWRRLHLLLAWSILGAGTSLTVAGSLVRSVRRGGAFKRTPKYRIESKADDWKAKHYFDRLDRRAGAELAGGLATLVIAWFGLARGSWLLALYSSLFGIGFLALGLGSIGQGLPGAAGRPPWSRRALRHISLPTAITFLAAAGVLLAVARLPDPFEDSYHHWLIAATLASSGQPADPLFGMQDTWLPGYHLVAALVLKVFGLWRLDLLKLLSTGLALLSLALVHHLAGTGRRGRIAVTLLSFNPAFVVTASSVVAEPLILAALLGAALAAIRGRVWLAALMAGAACFTGTKAWLWLAGLAVVGIASSPWWSARRGGLARLRALAWTAPALALILLLEATQGFAAHSVQRAATEAASAAARGSLAAGSPPRALQFTGYLVLSSLPLFVLAPAGLILMARRVEQAAIRRWLVVPSLVYLAAVVGLVAAGAYSGSHRYYYLALPALAILAAGALERSPIPARLLAIGTAGLLTAGYLPVLSGLSAGNTGLLRAGREVAPLPGALLTDSPAVAFASGKPPGEIYGSRSLPGARAPAIDWMERHGVVGVALEDIDYYRAARVFPDLVHGTAAPPFSELGEAADYRVQGGKDIRVYTFRLAARDVGSGASAEIGPGPWPPSGKTAPLAKGAVLGRGGATLAGGGMGFGVPIAEFGDGWWFPGPEGLLEVGRGGAWKRSFQLSMREIDAPDGRFLRFEPGLSHGTVDVVYRPALGRLQVEVSPRELNAGLRQVVVLNEEASDFDDYADVAGGATGGSIPSWGKVSGGWARFRSSRAAVEWALLAPPPSGGFYVARERRPPWIDFSGLEYVFGPDFSGTSYEVLIGRAR